MLRQYLKQQQQNNAKLRCNSNQVAFLSIGDEMYRRGAGRCSIKTEASSCQSGMSKHSKDR